MQYYLNDDDLTQLKKTLDFLNNLSPSSNKNNSNLKFKSYINGNSFLTFNDGSNDIHINLDDLKPSNNSTNQNIDSMKGGNYNNSDITSIFNEYRNNETLDMSVIFNSAKGGNYNNSDITSIFNEYRGGGNIKNNDTSSEMMNVIKGGSRKHLEFSPTSMHSQKGGKTKQFDDPSSELNLKGGDISTNVSVSSDNIFVKHVKNNNSDMNTLNSLSYVKTKQIKEMTGGAKHKAWKDNMNKMGINSSSSSNFCD